jgi:hypothetical protein
MPVSIREVQAEQPIPIDDQVIIENDSGCRTRAHARRVPACGYCSHLSVDKLSDK